MNVTTKKQELLDEKKQLEARRLHVKNHAQEELQYIETVIDSVFEQFQTDFLYSIRVNIYTDFRNDNVMRITYAILDEEKSKELGFDVDKFACDFEVEVNITTRKVQVSKGTIGMTDDPEYLSTCVVYGKVCEQILNDSFYDQVYIEEVHNYLELGKIIRDFNRQIEKVEQELKDIEFQKYLDQATELVKAGNTITIHGKYSDNTYTIAKVTEKCVFIEDTYSNKREDKKLFIRRIAYQLKKQEEEKVTKQ